MQRCVATGYSGPVDRAVIIPALDESENLPLVIPAIPSGVRVVLVDNGSTDPTPDVARALGAEVVHQPTRGYGSAVLAGMAHLQHAPPDIVAILDADGADDPGNLDRLTDPIARDEADFVLSDRTRTADAGALNPVQRFGNAFATALMARASGHQYADMGPFRAIRWSSLCALGMEDPTWGWNVEMQLKAVHHGLRIREIPLPYRPRAHGHSKISGTLSGVARAGSRILWAVHRYR